TAFQSSPNSNTNGTRGHIEPDSQRNSGDSVATATMSTGAEAPKPDGEDAASLRRHLDDLSRQRDAVETELAEIESRLTREHGVGLTEPALVDSEGYPLADVDIYAVRHLRSRAHELRNDYSALTGRIEPLLHRLHAAASVGLDQLTLSPPTTATPPTVLSEPPLAIVGQVDSGSPAAAAGLQPGDIVLRVGPLSGAPPRPPLTAIAEHLRSRIGRPVIFA
uniref:Nas2_N domain-containing protein n=1 Tax=Macrostomum lignano TaxID=282301 RepID=A0A1I8I1R5_9PLAT